MNEAQALTLEAGKFYRTRDGRKVFIVGQNPFDTPDDDVEFPFGGFVKGGIGDTLEWFRCDGVHGVRIGGALDLVAEWVDPKRIKGVVVIYADGWCGNKGLTVKFENADFYKVQKDNQYTDGRYDEKLMALVEIDVLEGHGLNGEAA